MSDAGLSHTPLQPKSIKDIVLEQLHTLEITTAVIVDDAFSPGIDTTQWSSLIEAVRNSDSELMARIEELVAAETGNVEQAPSERLLMTIRRLVAKTQKPALTEMLIEAPREPALDALVACLRDLNLQVRTFWHVDDAPRDAHLYFVDYRLQPEDEETHGRDASRLISEALNNTGLLGHAPGAVLMSRAGVPGQPDEAEQEAVARNGGGFVRCNFRYFDKANLADTNKLHFALHDLLNSMPVGRDYFQQIRALQDAATKTVMKVAGEACSLLPADFRVFANRLAGQPQDLNRVADHLLGIFSGLLSAELRNNADIETTVKAFRDLLQRPGMMAPAGVHSHSLHLIHSKLIYDQSRATLQGDIAFGDIFAMPAKPGSYYLILTPECDIEPRTHADGTRGPKVALVFLVPGTPGNQPASSDETLACTPLFIDSQHAPATWIRWNLRKPMYIPWQRLLPERKRFKKWGRLRTNEAEQIQLQFATDLLAVGTDDVSGGVYLRPTVLWRVRDKKTAERIAELTITEMAVADDPTKHLWALAPGCEHELCGHTRLIAPAHLVSELRQYMPKSQFRAKLKEAAVGIDETEQTINLGWFCTESYRDQNWKAPRPPVMAAGAEGPQPAPPRPAPSEVARPGSETNPKQGGP